MSMVELMVTLEETNQRNQNNSTQRRGDASFRYTSLIKFVLNLITWHMMLYFLMFQMTILC